MAQALRGNATGQDRGASAELAASGTGCGTLPAKRQDPSSRSARSRADRSGGSGRQCRRNHEQGGGGAGGLGVINDEGDTLTLLDRITHHFTTSLSTIEISSLNASKLVKEFRKFFNDAIQTGIGDYKTYVVKNEANNSERMDALISLLDKNNILYGRGSGSGKGFNYFTGRDENFSIGNNDLIISAMQPRSALVKVLFEPKSKLVDSNTYDITAWSLPYVYGLKA